MANTVADMLARLRADTSSFDKSMRRSKGLIGGVASSLSRMGHIAGGILLADIFRAGARGLQYLAGEAFAATSTMQTLGLAVQTLSARELAGLANEAINTATVFEQFGESGNFISLNMKVLEEELGKVGLTTEILSGKFDKLADYGGNVTMYTSEMTRSWVDANSMFDEASVRADQITDSLKEIGVYSPYSIEAANKVFKLGLAYEWTSEEALSMTDAVLKTGAGLGASADMTERIAYNFMQLRLQGAMTARDFRELGRAGFNLNKVLDELSAQTDVTLEDHLDFNQAMKDGVITWEQVAEAFSTVADRDFGEASKRFAFTLEGIKNQFKDVFLLTLPPLFMPVAKLFGEMAESIMDWIFELSESGKLEEWGESIAEFVRGIVDFFMELQNSIGETISAVDQIIIKLSDLLGLDAEPIIRFKNAFLEFADISWEIITEGLGSLGNELRSIVEGEGGTEVLERATDALERLSDWMKENKEDLIGGFKQLVKTFTLLNILKIVAPLIAPLITLLGSLSAPILALIAVAGLLGAAWATDFGGIQGKTAEFADKVKDKFDEIKGKFQEFLASPEGQELLSYWAQIKVAFISAWLSIKPAIDMFKGTIQNLGQRFMEMKPKLMVLWESVKKTFMSIVRVVAPIVETIIKVVGDAVGAIITGVSLFLSYIDEMAVALMDIFIGISEFIGGFFDVIHGIFTGNGEKIKAGGKRIWEGIQQIIIGVLNFIKNFFTGWGAGVLGFILGFGNNLYQTFKSFFDDIRKKASEFGSKVKFIIVYWLTKASAWILEKWENVKNFFTDTVPMMIEAGKAMIKGLWDGIKDMWGRLKSDIEGKINRLKDKIKSILKIGSPSRVFVDIGQNMMKGMQVGIEEGSKAVDSSLAKVAGGFGVTGGAVTSKYVQVGNIQVIIDARYQNPDALAQKVEETLVKKLRMDGLTHQTLGL